MQSAINAEGQMTPPKQILDHLGVKPGDQVRFFIHPDGTVVMLPTRPVTDLRGMIKYAGPPATIEEMDEAHRRRGYGTRCAVSGIMLTDDDQEPRNRPGKPRPLDDLSIGDLNAYVAELQAEIARVEAAITAKRAHMTAMAALFKTPE